MVTIDWMDLLSGGGQDPGHFLGTSLLPEDRGVHEIAPVTQYHETLLAQGITDFSLQECIYDYRISLVYPIYVVVSVTGSVNMDARGRELFLPMFNRSCEAIRESNALELVEAL